ncbi:CoA-binding protein [Chloroflexota bacterium]
MRNMSTEDEILKASHLVAIVVLSSNPKQPSHIVASYLKVNGYKIIPVNPNEKSILEETSYPNLVSITQRVDVIDIFKRSEDVLPIVRNTIRIGTKAVWMQEGITNKEAADIAQRAGLKLIMDRCMLKENQRLEGHTTSK